MRADAENQVEITCSTEGALGPYRPAMGRRCSPTDAYAGTAARKQSAKADRVSISPIILRLHRVASRLFGTQPVEVEIEMSVGERALLIR